MTKETTAIEGPTDSIQGSTLTQALKLLNKVADPKSSYPMLSNVRMESKGDNLVLRASDLYTHLEVKLPYTEKKFLTCVNAKALGKMIATKGKKQGERVKFELIGEKLEIETHGLQVKLGTHPTEDFPTFPKSNWKPIAEWSSKAFADALEYVLPAASEDETRLAINSLLLQDGKIIATDGHRMHWAPTPTETKEGVVMSRDAAKVLYLLVGLTDKVAIFKGENRLLFQTGNWCMACRTPDTQFPPYNQVIPKHQTGKLRIESGLFVNAVKKLKLLASVRTEGIRLTYNQKLEIFVNNPELGDASVELNVSDWNQENPGHLDSPEIQIGFCATYLLEAVAKSKEFILKFDSELDPIIISDGERGAVVMPMRI